MASERTFTEHWTLYQNISCFTSISVHLLLSWTDLLEVDTNSVLRSVAALNAQRVMIFSVMFKVLPLELLLFLWQCWWSLTLYSHARKEVRNEELNVTNRIVVDQSLSEGLAIINWVLMCTSRILQYRVTNRLNLSIFSSCFSSSNSRRHTDELWRKWKRQKWRNHCSRELLRIREQRREHWRRRWRNMADGS